MGLNIIMPWSLSTTFGNEPHLVLGNSTFFVSFLGKHPFICYRFRIWWLVYKLPCPHFLELVKLCLDCTFSIRPFRGCLGLFKAVAIISGYHGFCIMLDIGKCTFLFLIWEGVIYISIIGTYPSCFSRFVLICFCF